MIGRLAFVVVAVLSLSGCIVGDGIAHVVKLTEQSQKKTVDAPVAGSAATVPVAPHDDAPPPAPAAAPSRSAVSVETLAPPSP